MLRTGNGNCRSTRSLRWHRTLLLVMAAERWACRRFDWLLSLCGADRSGIRRRVLGWVRRDQPGSVSYDEENLFQNHIETHDQHGSTIGLGNSAVKLLKRSTMVRCIVNMSSIAACRRKRLDQCKRVAPQAGTWTIPRVFAQVPAHIIAVSRANARRLTTPPRTGMVIGGRYI